ncbi:sensor histidine kinase [Euzebyella saccharophila]|uniref:histidine kinase n=1 Tax=Euzebyella saccharophila TaxID=679664 RepID=A0ABV8JQI3_9FLAO|nr:sensor histidine kinase [Euzebyella saccharophila]
MKLKLTSVNLIIISLVLFIITNLIIWTSASYRIETFTTNILELEQVRANNRIDRAQNQFLNLYDISKKNISMMRNMVQVEMINKDEVELIAFKMSKFIEMDSNYFQARIIDSTGAELIKVETVNNGVRIVPSKELQSKANRYYVKEALKLKEGELYVSKLDLNMENGEIEKPYRPTIRFLTPLVVKGEKIGIIGLNLNIKNWFDSFAGKNIGLLNGDNVVFFDEQKQLYQPFDEDLNVLDKHAHPKFYHKILSLEGNQSWTLYTRANTDLVDARLAHFKRTTYRNCLLLSAGVLFLLIITYTLLKKNSKISTLNKNIESQLRERDTLIKEIHHRVKNNLQVVASLLSLQSSFIEDESIKVLFRYSQYRINSMGMVHEMLYKSGDLSRIDYKEYVTELVNALIQSMKGRGTNIKLKTEIDNIHLNLDTSIPLGLIVNEIVTNSLKYGFANENEGTIFIKLKRIESSNHNYKLIVSDDGVGFPDTINFRNTKSLGLKLIHKLTLQLRGNIEKDNSKKGTYYIITFKEIEQIS